MSIFKDLDSLNGFQDKVSELIEEHQRKVKEFLSDEVYQGLLIINEETSKKEKYLNEQIGFLTDKIKTEVLGKEESVKGEKLSAVWSKGRKSWDSKGLEGYALLNPEVLKLKKQGKPFVSIKKIKR